MLKVDIVAMANVVALAATFAVVAVAVDPGAYPAAPANKKLERKSLLADDGAAEGHAESL